MRQDFEMLANTSVCGSKNNVGKRRDRRKAKLDPEEAIDAKTPGRLYGWDYYDRKRSRRWHMVRTWLMAQVGRPWNSIYSEVCSVIKDSEIRHEFRREMDGWKVFVNAEGILCKRKLPPRWRRENRLPEGIVLGSHKLQQYHCVSGVWYEIQLRTPTPDEIKHKTWGVTDMHGYFYPRHCSLRTQFDYNDWRLCHQTFGEPLYPVAKRQLNSKEITKLGLRDRSKK